MKAKKIFQQFKYLYQQAWESQFPDEESMSKQLAVWEELLEDKTQREIDATIKFLIKKRPEAYLRFPPTALQFLNLIDQVKATLLPSVMEAYRSACQQNEILHPLVKRASDRVGRHELVCAPSIATRRQFEAAYKSVLDDFLSRVTLDYIIEQNRLLPAYFESEEKRLIGFDIDVKMRSELKLEDLEQSAKSRSPENSKKFLAACEKIRRKKILG